jgi:hypothetical protein
VRATGARVSVDSRKFSQCIARVRRARAGWTVYPPCRALKLLAFDEKSTFNCLAVFPIIKRASFYKWKKSKKIWRAARARCIKFFLLKFTKTRARAPSARHALILPLTVQ